MSIRLDTATKAGREAIARHARRYGYFSTSERHGWVNCPVCRGRVDVHRDHNPNTSPRAPLYESWARAIDRAMLAHLDPAAEACPKAVGP